MTTHESSGSFNPFGRLKTLLKNGGIVTDSASDTRIGGTSGRPARRGRVPCQPGRDSSAPEEAVSENARFRAAMADVTPIRRENIVEHAAAFLSAAADPDDPDRESMMKLRRLVDCGEGFVVAHTSEYMEGSGWGVHPALIARLHRGDFSIQAHVDLHGHTAAAAHEVLDAFLKASIQAGLRAVLIVHGRGLSSPSKPVLKSMVYERLTGGPWRKWVLAFCSARPVDGGTGATAVLLRVRPDKKRRKKR